MRKALKISSFIFAILLPFSANAETVSFLRNLKLGDKGLDVRILQKFLNGDSGTLIIPEGPGSPGQETDFFGPNTHKAVVKYQEKYKNEVLSPAGLSYGTGFVGPLTRKHMEKISHERNGIVSKNPVSTTSIPKIPPPPTTTPPPTTSNSNAQNLDIFLEEITKIQIQKGKSREEAETLAEGMRQIALSTTTNFRAKFSSDLSRSSGGFDYQPPQLQLQFPSFLRKLFPRAHAQVGLPFGGMLTYAFPCGCSATTLVTIISAGTTSGVFDYVYGTQAFGSYNAPYATWWLGLYMPGAGVSCYVPIGTGCVVIPSGGMITSMVGTSPY